MFQRKKKKLDKKRRSLFVDDFISDNSIAHCYCELYVPEPSFKYDDFGVVKEICMSGDVENFLWSKHCMLHICELPLVDPNFPITLQDTGQDFEICLNITLNKQRKGDLVYLVRDELWHECRQKVGLKWRTFVLKFEQDNPHYAYFQLKLNSILQLVESQADCNKTYLLVGVQGAEDKAVSPTNQRRFTLESDSSQRGTSESSTTAGDQICNSGSDQSEGEEPNQPTNHDDAFMEPPFDPAPFETAFTKTIKVLKNFSQEFARKDKPTEDRVSKLMRTLSNQCDSLHIHPNELPQTLESLLHSIREYSNDLDYTKYDPRSTDTVTGITEGANNNINKLHNRNTTTDDPNGVNNYDDDTSNVTKRYLNSETNPRLLSEHIPLSERYIPMGTDNKVQMADKNEDKMAASAARSKEHENPKLKKANKIGELLSAAINDGDRAHARDYAEQLAGEEGINVNVVVSLKPSAAEDLEKEFSLKVFIEDKESSGVHIMLKVRASDTIRDLKNRMLMKHMFPVEVQTWIIGQRIPPDTETLSQCKVKNDGSTVYLYLVSAKSVGLSREEFMNRQAYQPQNHVSDYEDMSGISHPAQDPYQVAQGNPNPGKKASKKQQQNKPKQDNKVPAENLLHKSQAKVTPEKLQQRPQTSPGQEQGQQPKGQRSRNEGHIRQGHLEDNPPGRQQTPKEIHNILEQIRPDIFQQQAFNAGIPLGMGRVPVMHPEEVEDEPSIGWSCAACTFLNQPTRPGCEVCGNPRPADYVIPDDYVMTEVELERIKKEEEQERKTREAEERQRIEQEQERGRNYQFLQQADAQDVIPNTETFQCPICFDDYEPNEGVVLRECLHSFCRDCLHDHVQYNEQPVIHCPYQDDEYMCDGVLQDREIKALVPKEIYDKYLSRSLTTAESQAANSFHCKTADCPGWCLYEDHNNFFLCPACQKQNCLTCKAIHQGQNCKQYQEDLRIRAMNDGAARDTQIMIKRMVDQGDAMPCPQCQVIVMKKEGCDWIQCSICKTEICWVTKGPRWGPMGSGDISGGCRCRVNGEICHPDCNNCH